MPTRQTRNVSLPPKQDQFVDDMVSSGRYRTASEVVREGIRLLQEAEHRRLLEKWIYDGLTADEEESLPAEVRERARQYFADLLDKSVADRDAGQTFDGPSAMAKLRADLEARRD